MSDLKGDSRGLSGPKSDVNIYEDDGFFSDVPASGSLSKSLRALNKYMKTNLLYEDSEEMERDSDYFSKESSPNESVSKCDSESVISNESYEKNSLPVSVDNSDMSNTPSSKALSANSKSNNENNIFNTKTKHVESRTTNNENIIPDANPINKQREENYSRAAEHSDDRRKPVYQSAVNLTDDEISQNKAAIRQKTNNDVKNSAHRHTVHEFNNWGNRTNTYPDVYAPLPYKSPRRYVENEVNIHYRCPVRRDPLPLLPERELARQQSEHMKRVYRDQRRAKYLQDLEIEPSDVDAFDASIKELQDMQARRHQDNFTPAQKSILPLDRYEAPARGQGAARALYAFSGQTPRELSFRKGELIAVRRQVDDNWYEGELHGKVGLFPYNYVEMVKADALQSSAKSSPTEGRARAKFEFVAQTSLELPLKKGELVALSRRIDQNWWEGRVGGRTGIFPDSYVHVLQEPGETKPESAMSNSEKPVSSPAAHGLLSGGARRSMGSHSYMPHLNSPALSGPPATMPLPGYTAKPVKSSVPPSERGYGPPSGPGVDLNNTEPLYVDTNAEAVPYRAMYKYRPQNPDELELAEGDTVYVLEQCDDGWYVGSSQRTGRFGTFPGNYVERI